MASQTTINCGSCNFEGFIKTAKKWCTNCEEGLCEDCEKPHRSSKSSRNHKIISVDDYTKIQHTAVNLSCTAHNKSFELYCKSHEEALCVVCFPSKHRTCTDIVSIEEIADDYKSSYALTGFKELLTWAKNNVDKYHDSRISAIASLDEEKRKLYNTVKAIREQINNRLSELEDNLRADLEEKHSSRHRRFKVDISKIDEIGNRFRELDTSLSNLKEHVSDVQIFLSSTIIRKRTEHEITALKEAMDKVVDYRLDLQIQPAVTALLKDIAKFAEIELVEKKVAFPYKNISHGKVQAPVTGLDLFQNLKLERNINIEFPTVRGRVMCTGCTILSPERILIADGRHSNKLIEYTEEGKFIRCVSVGGPPWDVVAVGNNRIVVSLIYKNRLVVLDLDMEEKKSIELRGKCYGVTYYNDKIYVVVRPLGIVAIDITGNILNTIKIDVKSVTYLTASKDKLFYSNGNENSVHCCSNDGTPIWTYKDGLISKPLGVSVDNLGNVFVASAGNDTLVYISR